jgi:hypothetical protein
MSKKAAQTRTKKAPAAAPVAARDDAAHFTGRAQTLAEVAQQRRTEAAAETAPDARKKVELSAINADHRAVRAARFASMFAGNKEHAACFENIANDEARVAEFDKSAIYVQDKVRDLIRALSDGKAAGNKMTIQTLRTIANGKDGAATRADVIADLQTVCGVSAGTAGSQSSSSLIALTFCRVIESDGAGRYARYKFRDADIAKQLAAL